MQKTVRLARDVEIVKAGQTDRVVLHYTGLDGSSYTPGTPDRIGALAVQLDAETLATVKGAKSGQILNIEMTKTDKYWNLTKATVGSSGTFVTHTSAPRPPAKKPFDDVGVKVGASRNQAIAFLSATKGTKFTLDDVDTLAYEIVIRQAKQEDNVRNTVLASREAVSVGSLDDSDSFFDAP